MTIATAVGLVAVTASSPAFATSQADIVNLANANLGGMACATNSLGGGGFYSSCTGNAGQPEYWCADFAKWVWANAGVADLGGLTPAARSFYTYGVARGILTGTPALGDAVVFSNNQGDTSSGGGGIHHVAIVTAVNANGTIETVSGDWGGESGSEAHFAGTSHVIHNTPAYGSGVGTYSSVMRMWIEGYIPAPGVTGLSDAGHHLVVGSSADGRMEVFAGTGSGVWHAYQTAADGPWSDWENIGGPANAALAIAAVPDGRLELFALNSQAFWHTYQTAPSGSWASWESNFGGGGYDVAVGRNKSGRLEVVASNGGGVYHKYQNTDLSWSGWGSLTGPNGGGANGNAHLAAASSADGRIEIFAMNDQSFFHTYQTAADGGWANWESDFGGGGSYLAVGTNKSGRLEVAASNGGGIYHKYQNTDLSWSGWGSLVGPDGVGGNGNAKLATERSPDGRIELFAVNSQVFDHIYQTATDGNWSNWETNFGGGGSDVAVGHNKTGRLEVVASNGGGIYHKYQNTDLTWSSWSSLVGPNGTGAPGI
ncbi:CHAP domain-containing protein [Fodinicola acaciae]|uniref:CHAP domain-containing protein n=1 Tax=Fodinicola acaciae TaxID=2681555 RepID=UPI0013D7C57A|nr:CHAP domain-containing protein [Fodinicola acaciae]